MVMKHPTPALIRILFIPLARITDDTLEIAEKITIYQENFNQL
jgi:hypothetical protein